MAQAALAHYSLHQYLELEEISNVRHEYLDGQIYAMAGGTPEHAALISAATVILGSQLRGGPCRLYSSDLRVRIQATGLVTYPDLSCICGPPERDSNNPTMVTNPTLLVEVLSPSTERYDREGKWSHYQQIPSLDEYLLLSQERPAAELRRRLASGEWQISVASDDAVVSLSSISCNLPLSELYAGIRG